MQVYLLSILALAFLVAPAVSLMKNCECDFPQQMSGNVGISDLVKDDSTFEVDYKKMVAWIYPGNNSLHYVDIAKNMMYTFDDMKNLKGACKARQLTALQSFPTCVPKGWYLVYDDLDGESMYQASEFDSYNELYVEKKGGICKPIDMFLVRLAGRTYDQNAVHLDMRVFNSQIPAKTKIGKKVLAQCVA